MYLINEEYVRNNTRIGKNTTDAIIEPYLQDVQDIHVADLLGIPLLELYLDHVQNGTPISATKAALLSDIKKYYAKRVEYEYTLLANVKLSSKGATVPEAAADLEAIEKVRSVVAQQFNYYQDRILFVLQKNKADFPEYFGNIDEKPVTSTAVLGFNFRPLPKKYYY